MAVDQARHQSKPETRVPEQRDTISAVIITLNEEEDLPRCLESVKWCDEIIVVDSHSTDRTREIAGEYGANVYEREWKGYAPQRNYGFEQVTSKWTLWLDADECVTPELKCEIVRVLNTITETDLFFIPRLANFLGRWMRHGGMYPGRELRLFRKGRAGCGDRRVHEGMVFSGETAWLQSPILHYTYNDLSDYFAKFNRYTSLEAQEYAEEWAGQRRFYLRWAYRTFRAFTDRYIRRQGFRDGLHGLLWAVLCSSYVFVWHAKYWEKHINPLADQADSPPPSEVLTTANDGHTF